MRKTSAKAFATPLVPPLQLPAAPKDRAAAANLWWRTYYQAKRFERLVSHFNPEYFLDAWTHTILDSERLRQDVWGWALAALKKEQEFAMGRPPNDGDMRKESQSSYFLERFKTWAEARLAYHRMALQLTFYKADPFASKEPIASNVDRLKARLADWRDVRLNEKEAITSESIEWLCWLKLISPISQGWQLHEIGLAVRKLFVGRDYERAVLKWWKNPPKRATYAPHDEGDKFADIMGKQVFSQEFWEWKADWLSKRLETVNAFTDTLRKQLQKEGFAYKATAGRPKWGKRENIPSAWNKGDKKTEAEALIGFAEILGHKESARDKFSIGGAKEDLEKDEPEGWLFAKSLTS